MGDGNGLSILGAFYAFYRFRTLMIDSRCSVYNLSSSFWQYRRAQGQKIRIIKKILLLAALHASDRCEDVNRPRTGNHRAYVVLNISLALSLMTGCKTVRDWAPISREDLCVLNLSNS